MSYAAFIDILSIVVALRRTALKRIRALSRMTPAGSAAPDTCPYQMDVMLIVQVDSNHFDDCDGPV